MQSFPVKLPTLWRQVFPGLVLGALLGRASQALQGETFSWPHTAPLMVAAAVVVLLGHALQPTQAGPAGLRAMTPWGFRRAVPWDDIASASFARMFLLQPSIRLLDKQGRSYWIARDTKNLPGLHGVAQTYGGRSHPLTRVLEVPLYKLP